jgi:hypothetical protein
VANSEMVVAPADLEPDLRRQILRDAAAAAVPQ